VAAALGSATPAAAQAALAEPPGALPVDGIAMLVGGSPAAEDEAVPVTAGQLELEAELLLIRRHGRDWKTVAADDKLRRQARRVAALVRLLARQARQMGETVAPEDREIALSWLEERAGGAAEMDALLARRGADRDELASWAEDALLAKAQIDFIAERSGGTPGREGPAAEGAEARRMARELQIREALSEWLAGALERTLLRLLP
jgi:hypothetical protein